MFVDILLLLILLAGFFYWLNAARAKEIARQVGRRACEVEDVQFLDESVVLIRLRLRRNQNGQLTLYREYQFEFTSDGGVRYGGEIIVFGRQVERVTLEPYRIP